MDPDPTTVAIKLGKQSRARRRGHVTAVRDVGSAVNHILPGPGRDLHKRLDVLGDHLGNIGRSIENSVKHREP
jgi:hypothetical protein